MTYNTTIGLEVHVQLKTRTKMFCGCHTSYGAKPNANVCPVCLGYPGAMPVMNAEAIRLTVISGLMLDCTICPWSKFDRKSYFYPDMPKNYQISQYDKPLCLGGTVTIDLANGQEKAIGLTRIHLEEDVGKSTHFAASSGVDFNRAGTPLMEIVTEPDINAPEEAYAFLLALKQILLYAGVSDCNLEEGNMRCDVNVSIRPEGQDALGTKVELKNLNTFKGVYHALQYEEKRQAALLDRGERTVQETRRWDPDREQTATMRTKEDAHDYRYFPEPDLLPVVLTDAQINEWRQDLPEAPRIRRTRLMDTYGLPAYDAGVLVAEQTVADFFEEACQYGSAKAVSNWVMTELLRIRTEQNKPLAEIPLTPQALGELTALVEKGAVNMPGAKQIFAALIQNGGHPADLLDELGLAQVSDTDALDQFVQEAIASNPQSVADYLSGKKAAAQFLMGQVMRLSKGKANPPKVLALLKEKLEKET